MEQRVTAGAYGKPKRLSRLLAVFCVLLLLAGVLPLYAIAFDNHPYYDDFRFSVSVHDAWVSTHSPAQVLSAAWASSQAERAKWQGTYTGTLLSNLQPGVFGESYYWVTTFVLLTAFLLCFGFLFHTVFGRLLGASRAQAVCVSSLTLFLMTQFLPSASEAFFWFNGGIGNTFIYSLLALGAALLIRLFSSHRSAPWLTASLVLITFLLGGGSYGGGLFGLLIYALFTLYAFGNQNRYRFVYAALTVWFALCFAYSVMAPGNGVRAAVIGVHPTAVMAVAKSLYYGLALIGQYATLPVLAAGLLLAPLMWKAAKTSQFAFRHPVWVLLGGICLFCAQLTPPLYGGVFLGGGRIMDTYYFSFVTLFFLYETYLLGFLARRREHAGLPGVSLPVTARRGLAGFAACLFVVGCLGYKPSDATLYGPMNMAGGSAALSIVTGESKRYDREMTARETLLNDISQPVVTLSPLTAVPSVFMGDLLAPGSAYNLRPTLRDYYHKQDVLVEGGDAQ